MMYPQPMTADDKRWRAESDANTLAEAQVIAGDPERMAAAKTAAKHIADERSEQLQGLRKVAAKKADSKPYTERGTGKGSGPGHTGSGPALKPGIAGDVFGLTELPVNFLK